MQYKKGQIPQGPYDVIVIGSGLGGLTASNVLAKNGHKVLLLEAHNKLGGFATWFRRQNKKHLFDVSLHGFPAGMIKTCRKYWNKKITQQIIQIKDIRFINPQFELQTDFTKEHYAQILEKKFGLPKKQVDSFFNYIFQMNFFDNAGQTNRELFERFFPGRNDCLRFLLEPIVYANGSTLDDPAISYGIVFSNFMKKGVYSFKGSTAHIISMMKEELLENGVHLKLQSKVDEILVNDNGHAYGVQFDGHTIHAKTVLSNTHLMSTVKKLVNPKYFSKDFYEQVKKIKVNSSSCQVYIGLKEGTDLPNIGELIFTSTHPTFDTDKILAKQITSRTFSVYYPHMRPEINRHCIVSSTNALYQDWKDLNPDEYEEAKKEMIEETLIALEKLVPNIRENIDHLEASTPRTVEYYTHHPQGASFGTKFEGLEISKRLPEEIPGLYHTGSVGIIMSGWLGAANYGVIVANEIDRYLDKKEI